MRCVILSDTHWMFKGLKIPECDILLHTGDLQMMSWQQAKEFGDWWNSLEATIKILTPGNHDKLMEQDQETAESYLDNTNVLINSSIVLSNGLCVSGTPYTPRFMNWHFMSDDLDCHPLKHFGCISPASDIILSHGPLHGIHDEVDGKYNNGEIHVGSKSLRKIIESFDGKEHKYLFHGHIHGRQKEMLHTKLNNVDIYNVSLCDEEYAIIREPLVLEI